MTLGQRLYNRRKQMNLTQEQLAEMMNTSRQAVSKWENDEAIPESDKLVKLSSIFECSVDELLGKTTRMSSDDNLSKMTHFIKRHGYRVGYFMIGGGVFDLVMLFIFYSVLAPFSRMFEDPFLSESNGFNPFSAILNAQKLMLLVMTTIGIGAICLGVYVVIKGKKISEEENRLN